MKLLALICGAWVFACWPSWAGDQRGRFLEFPLGSQTKTFDLQTVPGRFTIISTKTLYDCKRGLSGDYEDPTKAYLIPDP